MFGIFYGIFSILAVSSYKIKRGIEASNDRHRARERGLDTYTNRHGKTTYVKNGRWVCTSKVNGHTVLKDVMTDEVYRDYTAENELYRRSAARIKALQTDKTVYVYMQSKDVPKYNPWKGTRYKDLKTGDIYVKRRELIGFDDYCDFYVNISTGMYVRKTDEQKEKDKHWYKKLDSVGDRNLNILKSMTKNKNISDEEFNEKLQKMIDDSIRTINHRFINDERIDEYIEEINKKQIEYKEANDSLYYGYNPFD